MTKRQARDYLGVSLRTVERYLSTGRLPSTLVTVEGRKPRVAIADEEVVALKAAMDAVRAERAERTIAPNVMQHLSFRLEPNFLRQLEEEAARRRLKPTELARKLVTDGLSRQDLVTARFDELRDSMADLREEVGQLRGHFAELLYQIMVIVAKVDEDEARQWAEEVFEE